MDDIKAFYEEGFIEEETFKNAAVKTSLRLMEKLEYKTLKVLGQGAFGSVFEVRSPRSKSNIAVKMVLEHRVSKSELDIWWTLKHPNLLRLNAWNYFSEAYTYVFITEVCPTTLNHHFHSLHFLMDKRSLERSISWLRGILCGLEFLHGKNLCHLDLKTDNILISNEDTALITDFGFVSSTKYFTSGYGSPLIYRPPECSTDKYWAKVDGCQYDMWTVGLLALEMFTKESLLKEAMNWKFLSVDYWPQEIYPTIFAILQQKQFSKLMCEAFPASNVLEEHAVSVSNLIGSLLSLNPGLRPSSKKALRHKLFGGNEFNVSKELVWTRRVGVMEMKALMKMFRILELNRRPKILICSNDDPKQDANPSSDSVKCSIDVPESSTGKSKAKTNVKYEKLINDSESEKISDTGKKSGNGKRKFLSWVKKKGSFLSTVFNRVRPKKK